MVMFLTVADHERIIGKDKTGRATRIRGMSGAPVFDASGNLFGVLSKNLNRGETVFGENAIFIVPLRTYT